MASRTLDDITELLFPLSFAAGGLYLVWWLTSSATRAAQAGPDLVNSVIDYDVPLVGEGGFIDRWTLNPGEAASLAKRGIRRFTGAFR